MIRKSDKSIYLFNLMIKKGYPEQFCREVTDMLNTDWTAQRLIGYLSHYEMLPMEEVADEVLEIIYERERIIQKKTAESNNAYLNYIREIDDFFDKE